MSEECKSSCFIGRGVEEHKGGETEVNRGKRMVVAAESTDSVSLSADSGDFRGRQWNGGGLGKDGGGGVEHSSLILADTITGMGF